MYKREDSDGSTAERRGRGAFERHRSSKKSQPKEEKKQETVSRSADAGSGGNYSPQMPSGGYDDMAAYGAAPPEGGYPSYSGNTAAEFRPRHSYGNPPPDYRPPMAYGGGAEPRRRPPRVPIPNESDRPMPPVQPAQPTQPTAPANSAEPVSRMSRSTIMASQNSIFWPMLCWVIAVAVVAVVLPRMSMFSRVIEIEEQPSSADISVQESPDRFIAVGDEGAAVTSLQKALHQLGYLVFDDISGIYDAKTHEAVNLILAAQGIAGTEGCSQDSYNHIIGMAQNPAAEQPENSQ